MKKAVSIIAAAATAVASLSCSVITADATTIKGDVNGDNRTTLRDATLVQKIQVGMVSPNTNQSYSADFDSDGSIKLEDALGIQRFVCLDNSTVEQYSPNREQRIAFLEALNADRIAANLSPIEYNDAMLEAGNIRALEYYKTGTHTRPDSSSYETVLEECNLKYNASVPPLELVGKDGGLGENFYNNLKKKDAASPDQVYRLLMSENCTTVCVGAYPDPNDSTADISQKNHYWVILAN